MKKKPGSLKKDALYQLDTHNRIVLRKGGNAVLLHYSEILWIQAKGHYTFFHTKDDLYEIRAPIGDVEEKLKSPYFLRIHRSTMVNLEHIREVKSWLRGDYKVILTNGAELTCSRSFKSNLDEAVVRSGAPSSATPTPASK